MGVDVSSLRQAVVELASQAADQASQALLDQATERAHEHDQTGEMAASGHAETFTVNDSTVAGSIAFDSDHAQFVDEGTAPHVIEGNPLLAFEVDGVTVIVHSVQHPGYAGDRWFSDTVTDPNWENELQQAVDGIQVVA